LIGSKFDHSLVEVWNLDGQLLQQWALKGQIVHKQKGITLIVQVDRVAFNETVEWQLISSQSCLAGFLAEVKKRGGNSMSIDAPISQCDKLANFYC
jgi:hypothetical protein